MTPTRLFFLAHFYESLYLQKKMLWTDQTGGGLWDVVGMGGDAQIRAFARSELVRSKYSQCKSNRNSCNNNNDNLVLLLILLIMI
mmetsp:Transcript_6204/g.8940  ORF Transcript_6204/g.8940 Transcript_6204/m.8940 type:complete len:85 (+) Transcript_6204:1083-1337(+)